MSIKTYLGDCSNYIDDCPIGVVPTGTPVCENCQLEVEGTDCYCATATAGNTNNNLN